MKKTTALLCVIAISACSSVNYIQESFKADDFDFDKLKNSEIKFAGTEKIYLKEFNKTFSDEYSDTNKLNDKLYDLFSREFKIQIPGIKLSRLESEVPQVLQGNLSFKNYNQALLDNFFSSLKSDYLIFISSIEISNAYDNSQYFNAATNTMSGSSLEDCIISMEVECWDVVNQKRLLRFKGIGKDTVILFSYLSVLNIAMQNAVVHSVEYIKDKVI